MDWSLGNLVAISLRAITHQAEIERVTRRAIDLLFELEKVHADLLGVIRKVAPELLTDQERRILDDRASRSGGENLH
jgi:hypothetical protein